MRVKVKSYNRHIINAVNIVLIALFVILFIVYIIIQGVQGFNRALPLGIAVLSTFILFTVFNTLIFSFDFFPRLSIVKTITILATEEKYDEATEYLRKFCIKRRSFSTNQMILYYLGYLELLKDNISDALYYLTQFDQRKQSNMNVYCAALCLSLLYFLYMYNENEILLNEVNLIYQERKKFFIRTTKSNKEIKTVFYAIDCFNSGNVNEGMLTLQHSHFSKLMFIKRFVARNTK